MMFTHQFIVVAGLTVLSGGLASEPIAARW